MAPAALVFWTAADHSINRDQTSNDGTVGFKIQKGESIMHKLPAKIFLQKRCRISRGKSRENFNDSVSNCKLGSPRLLYVASTRGNTSASHQSCTACTALQPWMHKRGPAGSQLRLQMILAFRITSKASRVPSSRTSSCGLPENHLARASTRRFEPENPKLWDIVRWAWWDKQKTSKNINLKNTPQSPYSRQAAQAGLERPRPKALSHGTRWRAEVNVQFLLGNSTCCSELLSELEEISMI